MPNNNTIVPGHGIVFYPQEQRSLIHQLQLNFIQTGVNRKMIVTVAICDGLKLCHRFIIQREQMHSGIRHRNPLQRDFTAQYHRFTVRHHTSRNTVDLPRPLAIGIGQIFTIAAHL